MNFYIMNYECTNCYEHAIVKIKYGKEALSFFCVSKMRIIQT